MCSEARAAFTAAASTFEGIGLPQAPPILTATTYPAGTWDLFANSLENAGTPDVADLAKTLTGLDEDELAEWAKNHAQLAEALYRNHPDSADFPPGSPERTLLDKQALIDEMLTDDSAMKDDGGAAARQAVQDVSKAWNELSEERRRELLMLYPAFFGSLSGVNFTDRVLANKITAAGALREKNRQRDEWLRGNPAPMDNIPWYTDPGAETGYAMAQAAWERERDAYNNAITGLQDSTAGNWDLIYVSNEGDGRFISTNGELKADTPNVSAFLPGTTNDGADMKDNRGITDSLVASDGTDHPRTGDDRAARGVGYTFQGGDLPDRLIVDNIDHALYEQTERRFALFDAALDTESARLGAQPRQTHIGHSAGGEILLGAQKYGANFDAVVSVASQGDGNYTPTATDRTERFNILSTGDPIVFSQDLGGFGKPEAQPNNSINLSPGFATDRVPSSGALRDHSAYFQSTSTAVRNMRVVIAGEGTLDVVDRRHSVATGDRSMVKTWSNLDSVNRDDRFSAPQMLDWVTPGFLGAKDEDNWSFTYEGRK